MSQTSQTVIRREDYQVPRWLVDQVELQFDLDPQDTQVQARLHMRANPDFPTHVGSGAAGADDLTLNAQAMRLVDLRLDDEPLGADDYRFADDLLVLAPGRERFVLTAQVQIDPASNSTLNGLYQSNGNYFTQCEAEGFRRICPYPDRPDVMARFRVRIRADRAACPVLLSNGNLVDQGDCPDKPGWHYADWEDPFPKPCYLFALVAGRLVCAERTIRSGQAQGQATDKLLQVWVEPGNEDKTDHAMQSLVKAIEWDEARYGLPLDLDRFMIVAVSDFNMGAMENKGLNIFNTKYVFATPRIATDIDFGGVESVVGHEYFHNWTGNRVTCRDWFQLTLKEGLTVFRDQQFSADMRAAQASDDAEAASARSVKRIEDVRLLRVAQFPEDAGPMAHAIRPDSYSEINNFYTVTIYEKGAEVIRMLHTLVGEAGFRKGIDLYFARHDGQAVTCDDFLAAIADANGRDFGQFARWYSQAGTPVLGVQGHHDAANRRYELVLSQHCPPAPSQPASAPFHIPVAVGLLDGRGVALPLRLVGENRAPAGDTRVLELTAEQQRFVFEDIDEPPVPSLLRGFSAPVVLDYPYEDHELAFLARHDTDPFSRWEAMQRLAVGAVLAVMAGADAAHRSRPLAEALREAISDDTLDAAYRALLFTLPAEGYIAEQVAQIDPVALRAARHAVRLQVADALEQPLRDLLGRLRDSGPYRPDTVSAGRRALRNLALAALVEAGQPDAWALADVQVRDADNMTDRSAALAALVNSAAPQREAALAFFAEEFAREPLVLDKWFSLQASMHRQAGEPPVLDRVRTLCARPEFSLRNPNRARSVIFAFCNGNLAEFHAADGSGYAFWLEQIRAIDPINPQRAARLARAMDRWRKFDPDRQQRMQAALREVAQTEGLSRDVGEIIAKALAH
ncbi:MAG: aminopeptidase N [Burkholderiaceae bacterium]